MKAIHSMRWRLQFWYGILLAVVMTGFGITAYLYERSSLLRSTDAELERRVGAIGRILRSSAPPVPRNARPQPDKPGQEDQEETPPPKRAAASELVLPPEEEAAYADEFQTEWYYVRWHREDGIINRSANAPASIPRPLRSHALPRGPNLRVRGEIREAFMVLGPNDMVLVGRLMTGEFQKLHRFAWLLALVAQAIMGLAYFGGYWLVSRSLRPIADISAAAAKIAGGDLSQRISTGDTDSELGQLAEVLNSTFARLEASFAQQARFTADAAHELRTPVSVLLTHTQNALNTKGATEEHTEAFAACQRAAQRMRSLIESLLWLARFDSGEQTLRKVRFDLARRVSDCVELVRPLAAARGISFHLDLLPAECTADPDEIDRVITNLVTNAIHHNSEQGQVWVTTRADGHSVLLRVADQGPGIPAEHLGHVFERFFRADKSRSRASGGTGLGLAITKAVVDSHQGTIRAESPSAGGAVFTVTLLAVRS